jgi:alkylation response protein AidB-like acyl-CoA dehydrogenase
MAGTDSLTVRFHRVPVPADAAVGGPGEYLRRPGFWHGAIGVAACWYGGAIGVARTLRDAARDRPDPHRLAHLGAVDSTLASMGDVLQAAARSVDADPEDRSGNGQRRARRVRATVERGCDEVITRTGRATGATPLCHDEHHARQVADLTVYLRQSHGEADLAALGELALAKPSTDWLPA